MYVYSNVSPLLSLLMLYVYSLASTLHYYLCIDSLSHNMHSCWSHLHLYSILKKSVKCVQSSYIISRSNRFCFLFLFLAYIYSVLLCFYTDTQLLYNSSALTYYLNVCCMSLFILICIVIVHYVLVNTAVSTPLHPTSYAPTPLPWLTWVLNTWGRDL